MTLYPLTPDQLRQKLNTEAPANVLCLGEIDLEIIKGKEMNLIMIKNANSMSQICEMLLDILDTFERWYNDMILAIVRKKPLQEILEIASQKLPNPFALFDVSQVLIHKVGIFLKDYKGTIWEPVIHDGHASTGVYSVTDFKYVSEKCTSDHEPFIYASEKDKKNKYLIAPIYVKESFTGTLALIDLNTPFTPGQLSIVAVIQKIVELALENAQETSQTLQLSEYYIARLLSGYQIEENIIRHYLDKRKWPLYGRYYIANFTNFPSANQLVSQTYLHQIKKVLGNVITCEHENSIVAIVYDPDKQNTSPQFQKKLELFLKNNNLLCSVSSVFNNFMNLKYYYIQSKAALEEKNTHNNQHLFYFETIYQKHIIHSLDNALSLKSICNPKLLDLWASGIESNLT